MPNLKEIRNRIASITTIRQVTSAMKMVAAAKLKKAQDSITQIRPYAEKMNSIIGTIALELNKASNSPYMIQKRPDKVLIVVIASNKGQCGAFNSNITKKAEELAQTVYSQQSKSGKVHFLSAGKQGEKRLKIGEKNKITETAHSVFDKLDFESAANLANHLMELYSNGKYDRIEIVYNQFKNAAVQILKTEQFLPVSPTLHEESIQEKYNFIFEPGEEEIIDLLIPQSLRIQIYKALLDSNASEQGARMTAMHQATDNASDLLKELTLNYNKARQSSITNELIEIEGGSEALNN